MYAQYLSSAGLTSSAEIHPNVYLSSRYDYCYGHEHVNVHFCYSSSIIKLIL